MWYECVMFFVELLGALCAVALCGPCLVSCARRLLVGDELLTRGGCKVREAEVHGCDEPACPYYKKNIKYLMVPANRRRRRAYASPER